jgi:hypothetical protein
MFRSMQCYICLENFRAPANSKGSLASHMMHSHGWPNCAHVNSKIKAAIYFWAFSYGSQCLALLNSSLSKQEYISNVAKIGRFSTNELVPQDFPPDYSDKLTEKKKKELAHRWKGESVRIESECVAALRVHQFRLGMFHVLI